MSHADRPLVVGAGPVGLSAALFLARRGQAPRVVEMREEPSWESRALAVNPRTLEILRDTGVTQRMLELGLPIRGARFCRGEQVFATLSFDGIHPDYPFMLALSQASTERLLSQALEAAGGHVERGVKMTQCRTSSDYVEAILEPAHGRPEAVLCPWMLAADGAHSTAREQLGLDFAGSSFSGEWYLADAPLRTRLAVDHAHVFFLEEGAFIFMVRVVDEALEERPGAPLWRVIGNRPDPLSRLIQAEQAGPPVWSSSFGISHRMVPHLAAGRIFFAGDAAHIHSPVGARGMNLGIEDASTFAELVRRRRLADYDRLRRSVDRQVVRRVELLSRIAAAESEFYGFLRAFAFPVITKTPFARARMVQTVTGLDHELPAAA